MVTIKNRARCSVVLLLALATLVAGCRPPAVRALVQGRKLLERGEYPRAIEKLKEATDGALLRTNAQAWNYLGLAFHQAGQAAEAERAYQRALALNHDLTEAHYNLGCLWLAQNRFDAAKTELTAYTLRQENSVDGLLKLGTAQLRLRELGPAEISFKEALRLHPQDVEALNGLGLVRFQRGRAAEAAQYFNSALKQQPDYGPALLNLAAVSQQSPKGRQLALQKYREYLALKPTPANAAAVSGIVRQLEQELNPSTRPAPLNVVHSANAKVGPPQSPAASLPRSLAGTKAEAVASTPRSAPAPAPMEPASQKVEVVTLAAEPAFKSAQDVAVTPPPTVASTVSPLVTTSSALANPSAPRAGRRGFLQRVNPLKLFAGGERTPSRVTPTPTAGVAPEGVGTNRQGMDGGLVVETSTATPSVLGRYAYRSLAKPAPGDRAEAEHAFAQGVQAQKAHRMTEAAQAYRMATQMDPSFFEAYYNLGLAAAEAGNLRTALTAYENALVIQSDSVDTRYNFALVLKQANYLADASNELEKLLTRRPNEVRAHLALGNLYAQQLHQAAKARQHYLKVLEEDPRHPQAGAIRYWLTDNK